MGKPFQTPEEYDDPNSTIENILAEVKEFVSVFSRNAHEM